MWGISYEVNGMYTILGVTVYPPDLMPTKFYRINIKDTYEDILNSIIANYLNDYKYFDSDPWWERILIGDVADVKDRIQISIDDIRISHPQLFI